MKLPSYIHLSRHCIYIFRRRIPIEIQQMFYTNELRISLRTSNLVEAIAKARILAFNTDSLFFRLKNNMALDDVNEQLMKMLRQKQVELQLKEKNEELERQIVQLVNQRNANNRQHERELNIAMTSSAKPKNAEDKKVKAVPKLKELIDDFFAPAEIKRRANKQATVRKDKDALSLFVAIVGDKPIDEVVQKDAVKFSNDIASFNKTGEERSVSTINNQMGSVSKFSDWVAAFHSEFNHTKLEFRKLRFVKEKAPNQERDMFEMTEVKQILEDSIFQGKRVKDESVFWLISIAIYSGMRAEEITQMNPKTDIYMDDANIWVFDINEKDRKSLKNKSSIRLVPVHSKLIEMGVLSYIEKIKPKSNRMFPDSKIRDGRTGKNLSKKANYFLKTNFCITGKTLHSFRHTFSTLMKRNLVDESIASALLGHAHGKITYSRYGKQHLTELLQEKLEATIKFN